MNNCITCSNPLIGKQKKYCSPSCKNKSTNNIHQVYNVQKQRGLQTKLKLLNLKGGKCENCGYQKNHSALCFHHLKDKKFKLDARNCSNKKWESLLDEANKCIVLCHNCHMELHYPQHELMVGPLGIEPRLLEL